MKVLFLSNEYGIARSGSAYTHRLEKLSCGLQKMGIQTKFLSLREQPFTRPILAHPLNFPFIRDEITNCDFIHAGGDATYTAAFLRRYTKARIIYDVHGDTLSEAKLEWSVSPRPRIAYWVVQAWITNAIAYRYADYFLVVSKPLQQRLMNRWRIPARRIGLVRNGVDLTLFERSNVKTANGFVVCYAGGFASWQGIDRLLSAFELLSDTRINLRIVGFTEDHAQLKAQILDRLAGRVELLPRVPQRELVSQLATADVLIIPRFKHPAVEVALPTKFAEYLAVGKPITVCNVDETAELVRQHRCGLVSEPSPKALAEALRAAANLTKVELNEMGQNARRLAELEFSWEIITPKYGELLNTWSAS